MRCRTTIRASERRMMARPSYLSRRDGGRYYLQLRLPPNAFALYGRAILRASLRTSDFNEARRRLVDNLGWVQELVAAPDLKAIGAVIHQRLQRYTAAGAPQCERALAERVAFEHQVRHYMGRANERGYAFARALEGFANHWVDFVDQNKTAEGDLDRQDRQQQYERGRADATTAVAKGWLPAPAGPLPVVAAAPATAPVSLSDAVHQTINVLVAAEVAKQVAKPPAPVPASGEPADPPAPSAPATAAQRLRLSQARARYLAPPGKKRRRKTRGRADTAAIVKFAIDFLGDPVFENITLADWDRLDDAMTDIPLTKNIPQSHRGSLFLRYKYALDNGWAGLSRASVTKIEKRYHDGMEKFIHWAIEEDLYLGKAPKFECIDENNTAALPRDAFDDEELIALIKLPLFTGCAGRHRIWQPGSYLVQDHLYWGYLILIFSGMRPGEVGQLHCADLVTDGENWFFDLRPFDARQGRVALKDLRNLKTNAAGRVVPVHPLLIELGLLDRVRELEAIEEKRLFPDWTVFTRGDGTVRWSQPLTKSWQYIKKHILKITRLDLTLYGLRHLLAEWLDNADIAQRTRNRILGHATSVPERYGRKGRQSREQVVAIEAAEPMVVKRMRDILMTAKQKADAGELVVLTPWRASATLPRRETD
jgi:integrase